MLYAIDRGTQEHRGLNRFDRGNHVTAILQDHIGFVANCDAGERPKSKDFLIKMFCLWKPFFLVELIAGTTGKSYLAYKNPTRLRTAQFWLKALQIAVVINYS